MAIDFRFTKGKFKSVERWLNGGFLRLKANLLFNYSAVISRFANQRIKDEIFIF
jgi:hypothetical protein